MNTALRLAASPFAALSRWFKRRHVRAQIRSCDTELEWIRRLRERDELRISLIDLED